MPMIRVTDVELHRRARVKALERGETLQAVVEAMLRAYVADGLEAPGLVKRAAELSQQMADVRALKASATCLQCSHPFAQHKAQKGSKSLFCQVAGCACRVSG